MTSDSIENGLLILHIQIPRNNVQLHVTTQFLIILVL